MKPTIILAWGVAFLAASAQAQTTIDTTPFWNGTDDVYPFGLPYTATYGQTITVPLSDPYLTSFSFEMNLPATVLFQGYVYAWNGTEASGTALYTSSVTFTAGTGFQEVTFDTGTLSLTPGSSYVLFASVSANPTSTGTGSWGQPGDTDVYSGGAFVWLDNGTYPSEWTTTPWTQNYLGTGGDLAFKASFVPTPEPSASVLAGLAGLSLLFLHRHK
jgi:hypothetical protein